MTVVRTKLTDIPKSIGNTVGAVINSMADTDIKRGILADADSPNLTDEELADFKRLPECGEKEDS